MKSPSQTSRFSFVLESVSHFIFRRPTKSLMVSNNIGIPPLDPFLARAKSSSHLAVFPTAVPACASQSCNVYQSVTRWRSVLAMSLMGPSLQQKKQVFGVPSKLRTTGLSSRPWPRPVSSSRALSSRPTSSPSTPSRRRRPSPGR